MIKPTPEEVSRYAYKVGFVLNGHEFCDYYESKGWMVSKSRMKVWQAAVRTWKNKHSRWEKEKNPEPIKPDTERLKMAEIRLRELADREWHRKELIRLAQIRNDARTQ